MRMTDSILSPYHMFSDKYVPKSLSEKDKQTQTRMLMKSRRMYRKHQYYTRKKIPYKSIKSNHVKRAYKIYGIKTMTPNKELSLKTGCTLSALKQIVKRGEGAYYSSGSRPNQTPQSWGLARLASSITSGKSSVVDFDILKKGCNHNKPAYRLAR